jgi:hypothetical protein
MLFQKKCDDSTYFKVCIKTAVGLSNGFMEIVDACVPNKKFYNKSYELIDNANIVDWSLEECPKLIRSETFISRESVTLPIGLNSVTVRNKGCDTVLFDGTEVCPNSDTSNNCCNTCDGESVTKYAGCDNIFSKELFVEIKNGCAEITVSWFDNLLLDNSDDDNDGIPNWLEALNPCLALPAPDVTVNDLVGNPVGMAYSFVSPCFDVLIEDLANNISYYAASTPMLNKAYVAQQDLSGAVTHYLLAL